MPCKRQEKKKPFPPSFYGIVKRVYPQHSSIRTVAAKMRGERVHKRVQFPPTHPTAQKPRPGRPSCSGRPTMPHLSFLEKKKLPLAKKIMGLPTSLFPFSWDRLEMSGRISRYPSLKALFFAYMQEGTTKVSTYGYIHLEHEKRSKYFLFPFLFFLSASNPFFLCS